MNKVRDKVNNQQIWKKNYLFYALIKTTRNHLNRFFGKLPPLINALLVLILYNNTHLDFY